MPSSITSSSSSSINTPTSSTSSFKNIKNGNVADTSISFRQQSTTNKKANINKSNSINNKNTNNNKLLKNAIEDKNATSSNSSLSNEIINVSSSNNRILSSFNNLAPSPILYNVSLAEAETYDDVESSISTSEPPIQKSDHNEEIIAAKNDETNFVDNINDYVDYVDNDENSSSLSTSSSATTSNSNNTNSNNNSNEDNQKASSQNPAAIIHLESTKKEDNNIITCKKQEEIVANEKSCSQNINKKLKINILCPVLNSSSLLSSPTSSLKSNGTNLTSSSASAAAATANNHAGCSSNKIFVAPEERLSNEAREYWATIDLYNNSKMAFNKRLKSVKMKREKLNAEMKQRNSDKTNSKESINSSNNNSHENNNSNGPQLELCTCVKCSIVYHEALIKGITDINAIVCNKCSNKLVECKCCSSHHSTNTNAANTVSTTETLTEAITNISINNTTNNKNENSTIISSPSLKSEEMTHFEDKLFNIKNELVNLSETSLDVFQLLLQLSDTMLELNNQLNTSTNANSFLLLSNSNTTNYFLNNMLDTAASMNNLNKSNENLLIQNEDVEEVQIEEADDILSKHIILNKENLIEQPVINTTISSSNYLKNSSVSPSSTIKTTNSCNSTSNRSKKDKHHHNSGGGGFNSISNIISKINNRSHSTSSNYSNSSKKNNHKININLISAPIPVFVPMKSNHTNLQPESSSNLMYDEDKTTPEISCTKFVDSLLNHTTTTSINNNEEFPSLLESNASTSVFTISNDNSIITTNQNNLYQCLDEEAANNTYNNNHISIDSQSIPYSASHMSDLISSISSSSSASNYNGCKHQPLAISNKIFINQNNATTKSKNCSLSSSSNMDLTSLPSTSTSSSSSSNNIITIEDQQHKLCNDQIDSSVVNINNNDIINTRRSFSVKNNNQTNNKRNLTTQIVSDSNQKFNTLPNNNNDDILNNNSEKSVAGLAANYTHQQQQQHRSNSVSYRNPNNLVSNTNTNHPASAGLSHSASIACRKPSFKFESNILNRVQNMSNVNKIKCLNKNGLNTISSQKNTTNNETLVADNTSEIKRNSLNNETPAQCDQIKLLKRHQSINKSVITNETIANMLKPSNLINAKMNLINNINMMHLTTVSSSHHNSKSNHQISLDSGIYLPSESEDCSFQMNVA